MQQPPTFADIEAEAQRVGLSLRDLAQRSGVHLATLYRWRAGNYHPTVKTVGVLVGIINDATQPQGETTNG